MSDAARFWQKVDKSGGPKACWVWKASFNEYGYGRFRFRGRMDKAHRVAVILSGREVKKGQPVLHECDNPACVNPAHLRPGTWLENVREMQARGKARGPDKLTPAQVVAIRASDEPQKVLAARYDVSQPTISHIQTGKRWRGK